MKLSRLVLAALLVLTPSLALADDDPAPRAGKHGKIGKQGKQDKKHKKVKKILRRFDRALARLDQDGDGKLGPDEVGDRFERLQRFDLDQDGWVTREEIIVAMKDRTKARKADRKARRQQAP